MGCRTSQLCRYFPKPCFPTCGLEINLRRLKPNRNLRVLTMAQMTAIDYAVLVKRSPRDVNGSCMACDGCARAVQNATAAALRANQVVNRVAATEIG